MDRAEWLSSHPYLAQIAEFQAKVEAAAAGAGAPGLPADAAPWVGAAGQPALKLEPFRTRAIEAGAAVLGPMIGRLAGEGLAGPLGEGVRELRDRFEKEPGDLRHAAEWVVNGGTSEAPVQAGLLRYLGWTAVATALAPAIRAYQALPEDDAPRWAHTSCPTCGALPVMAGLVAKGNGRERRFACGLCRTSWAHRRTGCPYCQNDDPKRLDLFEIEGEPGLRLDACRGCTGYVKTVTMEDAPGFLLADWSTVHLDALAKEKGWKRLGASLYEL